MKKRDFRQKKFAFKRPSSSATLKRRGVLVICLSVIIFFSLVSSVYYYKRFLVSPLTHLKTWVNAHKDHLNQKFVSSTPRSTPTTPDEEPIHFKFYTTLPNMQVKVSEQIVGGGNKPLNKPERNLVSDQRLNAKKNIVPIVDVQELERELSDRIKQNSYIIQLGIFRTQHAAQKSQQTLIKRGLDAKMIVIGSGEKTLYKVQLGPYANKSQAKLAQQKLERKGVKGLISKIYP